MHASGHARGKVRGHARGVAQEAMQEVKQGTRTCAKLNPKLPWASVHRTPSPPLIRGPFSQVQSLGQDPLGQLQAGLVKTNGRKPIHGSKSDQTTALGCLIPSGAAPNIFPEKRGIWGGMTVHLGYGIFWWLPA